MVTINYSHYLTEKNKVNRYNVYEVIGVGKHPLLLAIVLGLLIPWLLFSGEENNIHNSSVDETVSQVTNIDDSPVVSVRFEDGTVSNLELEQYILGVLMGEIPESFELEAIKAQAVVARTFTVKNMRNGYKHTECDVCTDSRCCQSYYAPEDFVLDGGSIEKYQDAVKQTQGQVLLYNDELIEATYFSCSGGETEDAQAVWGTDIPYLQSQISPGEENATHYTDTVVLTAEEFQKQMGEIYSGASGGWIGQVTYTEGGGVDKIEIGGFVYTGVQIRQLLGLNSTAFVISAVGDNITITTKGFGHRVGMSQYGADAMAIQGKSYEEILSYYYPGTTMSVHLNV